MLQLLDRLLDLLLYPLNLVGLILVLDTLVLDLLALLEDLLVDGLLVLLPLCCELFQLAFDAVDFVLKHSQVLAAQLRKLLEHLLLLL